MMIGMGLGMEAEGYLAIQGPIDAELLLDLNELSQCISLSRIEMKPTASVLIAHSMMCIVM
jgi:hypothetical protein